MKNKQVHFVVLNAAPLLKGEQATNFIYEVQNLNLSEVEISNLNALEEIGDRISYLSQRGGTFKFKTTAGKIFLNNLRMVDGYMPEILAEMVLIAFKTNTSDLSTLVSEMEFLNPLGYRDVHNVKYYNYKIKELLRHLGLGMDEKALWTGQQNIYEHYPVLKECEEIFYYIEI